VEDRLLVLLEPPLERIPPEAEEPGERRGVRRRVVPLPGGILDRLSVKP